MTGLPGPREVHLWVADPTRPGLPWAEYQGWLSPDERARAGRFAAEKHWREYLATRALVRSVVSEYRTGPPESWTFGVNDHGKPRTEPASDLHFNLSNSPELVVCAISTDGPLGVDVEPVHRAPLIAEVAASVFSPGELRDLAGLAEPEKDRRRLRLWTLKEAYIKARGLGLALPLDQFSWRFGPEGTLGLEVDPRLGDQPDHWWFGLFRLGEHQGAVVAEGPGPVRLKVYSLVPGLSEPRLDFDRPVGRGAEVSVPLRPR